MRFGELRGLTSLPINRVRDQFRYEEVLTVLPVREAVTARETLLVATRSRLALLIVVRVPRDHWMTRWAPWEVVRLSMPELIGGQDDEAHQLEVSIGDQLFHAHLAGEAGRRALRDFVVATRMSQPARSRRP